MRKATEDKRRGIRLNFRAMLEDLDFADDIALLSSTYSDLQKNDWEIGGGSSQRSTQT